MPFIDASFNSQQIVGYISRRSRLSTPIDSGVFAHTRPLCVESFECCLRRADTETATRATLDAVEVTGSRIRHAVLAPVRSIKALTTGIQTGINTYRRRSRQWDEWTDLPEERIRYRSEAEAAESRRPISS